MAAGNNDIRDDVREIDTGAPMERFARGWHCVGLAEDFRDGQPHAVNAFGTRLVVFADSHGDLQVLDAYCRHMGGDLSRGGSVKGDSVACPFHDWRWQARPASAPWCRTPSAHRGWPAPDDGPPARSTASCWCGTTPPKLRAAARIVPPPTIEGYDEGQWSPWSWNSIPPIEGSHCREIVDNNVDMAHFFYIHHAYPTYFKNVIEGHTASQFMESKARPDTTKNYEKLWEGTKLRSEATYFGPAT